MDASKRKVLKLLQPSVLPRNDVVNLERRGVNSALIRRVGKEPNNRGICHCRCISPHAVPD